MKFAFSQLFARLHPHSRMQAQSNAYADGELAPAQRERFEKHLQRCDNCSQAVEATRATKTLLAALPMEEAPRSFRLTPRMVNTAVPEPRHWKLAPLHLAQATAALAAVGLLAVITVGAFQGSSSDSTTTAADGALISSNESKAAVPQAASGVGAVPDQAPPTATAVAGSPLSGASVAGAATAAPASSAPAPPQTGVDRFSAGASPTVGASGQSLSDGRSAGSPEPARDSAGQPALAGRQSSGDGPGSRRWIEIALLGVIAIAGIAWFGLSRNTRRVNS